jgi:hypothetical protein
MAPLLVGVIRTANFGLGSGSGQDWVGIGSGLGRDWVGIGSGLGRDWVGIGSGLGRAQVGFRSSVDFILRVRSFLGLCALLVNLAQARAYLY